jgi:hypothetical protein
MEPVFPNLDEDMNLMQPVKPYEDPLDRLDFPDSPSPYDNDYQLDDNYELEDDDYEPDRDDYEPDRDDDEPDRHYEDNIYDREESLAPPIGQKRPHSNLVEAREYVKARKIAKSTSRPKASDYAQEVQDVLNTAIAHYKADLLRLDPFPERGLELKWSKANWFTANAVCDLKIAHNSDLVKMVSTVIM